MMNAKLNNLLVATVAGNSLDVPSKARGRLQLLSMVVDKPMLVVLAARSMARESKDPAGHDPVERPGANDEPALDDVKGLVEAAVEAGSDADAAARGANEAREGAQRSAEAAASSASSAEAAAKAAEEAAKWAQIALDKLKPGDGGSAAAPAQKK